MKDICVSIFMLTYNQEEFIARTIESVMMQKTNFNYQLVIGEDCSTDRTREICKSYAQQYEGKIKLLNSDKNLGLINNFIRTYKECDGDYVAILDGDDYWTDTQKLQKQVNFLETNKDYSIVFTGFKKLFSDGRMAAMDYSGLPLTTDFTDLIKKNYICSATVMFRNKAHLTDFPAWIDKFPYGDWPLYLWITRYGEKVGFLDIQTAVYRKEIGVSEKLKETHSDIVKVNLEILNMIREDENFSRYQKEIKSSLRNHQIAMMASLLRENQIMKSIPLTLKLIIVMPIRTVRVHFYILKRKFQFI